MSGKPTDNRLIERVSARERELVGQVLDTQFRSSQGSMMTSRLERAFADVLGVEYAIAFTNGTATMHAALVAAGVGPGDEVIVPPLTMASTTFVVLQAGARPIFADVEPDTFQIDAEAVRNCCTERTKAIIPVALYGTCPDMDALMAIARERDLFVIEDAAEAMCASYKGRPVGTIGHVGSFSFQSSKHLTSGEGGMISTDDKELALTIRQVSSLGYAGVSRESAKITKEDIQDPGYARHVSFGFNYRMPELCAAVALAQLERRQELVGRRIDVASLFEEATRDCPCLVAQRTPPDRTNTYWTWVARLADPDITWHRLRDSLRARGGDGVYGAWRVTYLEPVLAGQGYEPRICPVAERIQPHLLQFRTNYWNWDDAQRQAEILRKTIADFG